MWKEHNIFYKYILQKYEKNLINVIEDNFNDDNLINILIKESKFDKKEYDYNPFDIDYNTILPKFEEDKDILVVGNPIPMDNKHTYIKPNNIETNDKKYDIIILNLAFNQMQYVEDKIKYFKNRLKKEGSLYVIEINTKKNKTLYEVLYTITNRILLKENFYNRFLAKEKWDTIMDRESLSIYQTYLLDFGIYVEKLRHFKLCMVHLKIFQVLIIW